MNDIRFVSTRGESPAVGLRTALAAGGAPDGGLYVPDRLPALSAGTTDLRDLTPAQIAASVLEPFTAGVLSREELLEALTEALDFPLPVRRLEPGIEILELFHGPTLAFKDVAARVLARLLPRIRSGDGPLTVLVATSGDTGAAVADAFHGVPGTRVVVLYPRGRVSPLQERQLATLGGNVSALAVAGSFDDCQRLVRLAFADPHLVRRAGLVSANSLAIGRLLPQIVYYFWAVSRTSESSPLTIAVPSGNFGNLTAGLMAQRMGLGAAGFLAATNVNDTVPRYLATGTVQPRPTVHTLASAMDVGRPSNLERLRWLYANDLDAIRRDVHAVAYDDAAIGRAIRQVWEGTGTALDPHTAVGYLALRAFLDEAPRPAAGLLVATAHPAKFPEIVEPLIDGELDRPAALTDCLERPLVALPIDAEFADLREVLTT